VELYTLISGFIGLILFTITFGVVWIKYKETRKTDLSILRISLVWFAVTVLGLGLYFFGDYLK